MLVSIAGVFGGFMGVGSVGYGSVEGGVEAAIDGAQAEFGCIIPKTSLLNLCPVAQSREVDHL
ncbi:MAG: hypothetical protein EAZ81_04090 [Verrucomicrobia bacterium]|nr:MAG: hypothetical protein EAZ81_04090 [Verrucomicrobiota bacterium]